MRAQVCEVGLGVGGRVLDEEYKIWRRISEGGRCEGGKSKGGTMGEGW